MPYKPILAGTIILTMPLDGHGPKTGHRRDRVVNNFMGYKDISCREVKAKGINRCTECPYPECYHLTEDAVMERK
jgi:hypothetical protein